jgi:hypothetical protein
MATELRVHGVSGSAAADVLDRPLVRQVAGDGDAGFFRPREEYGATAGPGGAQLEAYRWGNLTAGAAARALWLLLLPFTLVNVAMWLRPPSGPGTAHAVRVLCRLLALTMTATFVLAFSGPSIDLVAWQCPASPGCPADLLRAGFFAPTGRRLALLALVPIAALAVLWFLGRRSWVRYEKYPTPATAEGDGLADPCFWDGAALVGRLRAIHLGAGFATVDGVLLIALLPYDRVAGRWLPIGYVLAAGTVAVLAACAVALCLRSVVARDRPARWAEAFTRGLRTAGVALTALTFGYALLPRGPWRTTGQLPGYGLTGVLLFTGQALLVVLLAVVVVTARQRGAFLGGLGVPVLASLGVGLSVSFTAGLSYRVADLLDGAAVPSPADFVRARPLQPPPSYEWAALGFGVTLILVAAVVGVGRLVGLRRLRPAAQAVTDGDFPGCRPTDPARATAIDTAVADARLPDVAGRLLAYVYFPLAVAAAAVTGFAVAGVGPVELAAPGSRAARELSFVVNVGTYLIGFFAFALVVLGLMAYRYAGVRRIVGVLWDLGTFWPRAAHPLAPPCYSERVVPELVKRAGSLADDGGVILSGHSQGSVLVAAAVLQMPPQQCGRVALLTYGSPLLRLYGRLFPAYVNPDVLARVGAAVTGAGGTVRWINLWRATDPIGGVADAPARDERWADPPGFGIPPGDTVFPQIRGHSGYQVDPAFGGVVSQLLTELAEAPAAVAGPGAPATPPGRPVPPGTAATEAAPRTP